MFQQGGKLWVLDLPAEQLHPLDVTVADDGTRTGPHWVDAKSTLRDQDAAVGRRNDHRQEQRRHRGFSN